MDELIGKHFNLPVSTPQQPSQDVTSDALNEQLKGLIGPALTQYLDQTKRSERMEAKVVSAHPLTAQQVERIQSVLTKKTGLIIDMNPSVDPEVIGGFYILVNGQVFDGTIRTQLNTLKKHLQKGSYDAHEC